MLGSLWIHLWSQKLLCLFIASYRLFSTRGDQESVNSQRHSSLLAEHQSKSSSQTQGWQTGAHQQEAERTGYRERSPGSIDCCVHHSKSHSSGWQQALQQVLYATEKERQKWQRPPVIAMTMNNACWVDIEVLTGRENKGTYHWAEPQLYTVAIPWPPTVGLCREGAILDGRCLQPHNTPCSIECNMGHRGC
jgi:hypothetical protein